MALLLNTARDQIVGAFPPPPGVIPNFENPESRRRQVIIVYAIMFPLATLVIGLRLYTRAIIVRNLGPDDYAISLAWILSIGHIVIVIFMLNLGLGINLWNVPLTTFSPHFLKLGVIEGVFYGMSFLCVKVSILLLYLRLSPYPRFRAAVWAVMIATIVYSVVGSFAFVYNCQPIAKNWDVTITHGKCINVVKILMTHASLTIVTDIAMLLLPIALVRKLKLPLKQRVALAMLFMTGTFVCIISSIRMKTIMDIIRTSDMTGAGAETMVWTALEMNIGIICACVACFKPFFRRHFPGLLGSTLRTDAYSKGLSRAANTANNAPISGYELKSTKTLKNGMPQKSKVLSATFNESQEDILGDEFSKGKRGMNVEVITQDDRPLQSGNSLSDSSNALPLSREGL